MGETLQIHTLKPGSNPGLKFSVTKISYIRDNSILNSITNFIFNFIWPSTLSRGKFRNGCDVLLLKNW